jgi:O-antigen/teichoic acid export membrane protein
VAGDAVPTALSRRLGGWLRAATRLFSGGELVYVGTRYVAVVLVAFEALLFARLLGPDSYGRYALVIQLVALIPALLNVSTVGYLYAYYRDSTARLSQYYLSGALVLAVLVTGLLLAATLVVNPYLAISVLLFWIQALYFLTEPMLRVRNRFVLTTIGRCIGSAATLLGLAAWFLLAHGRGLDLPTAVLLMLAGNMAGYALYTGLLVRYGGLRLPRARAWAPGDPRPLLRGYWAFIVRHGLPIASVQVPATLFMYVDRMFIEHYRPPEILSTYALGWQLSQGGLVLLTSLGLVAQVRIGEALALGPAGLRRELRRQFVRMAALGGLAYGAVLGGAWLLSVTIYADYAQLVLVTGIIATGYTVQNVGGAVSHLIFYEKRLDVLFAGNGVLLLGALAANAGTIYFGMWYGVPVVTSCLLLIAVSVYFVLVSRALARGAAPRVAEAAREA